MDLFVMQTNLNFERKKATQPGKHNSMWYPTSIPEIKAFFSPAIAMGVVATA